jgi:hypothetical protein
MIINLRNNFLFIHIPKNSGTAMSKNILKKYKKSFLLKNVDRKTGIDKMHLYNNVITKYIHPKFIKRSLKFCIVRNPYNKIYSAWNFIKERHGFDNINDFIKKKLTKKFIYGYELIKGDARVHYRPQHTFILNKNNKIYVNFIIRYENLNNDIRKLNKKHNLKIPTYGNNKNKNYIEYLNEESIKKINELYKKDFELLNYNMIL